MGLYIDNNGNYPRYDGDIVAIRDSWAPGDLLPAGWQQVQPIEQPIPTETTYVYEEFPTVVDGILTQNWVVRPYTIDELEAAQSLPDRLDFYRERGLPEDTVQALSEAIRY
jgi:hypothetical protein